MAETNQYQDQTCNNIATIAGASALSNVIDLQGTSLVALDLPASLTNTTFNFRASHISAAEVVPLFDSFGVRISATVAADRFVTLDPATFSGVRFIQLEGATNEGSTVNIQLVSRPV